MKSTKHPRIAKILATALLALILLFAVVFILNLDLFLRLYHAYLKGALTRQVLQYEIAAYDLREPFPAQPQKSRVSPKDGMTQVYIPAGEFIMGNGNEPGADNTQHRVYLDAYWMDRTEVTNAMYAKCVAAKVCSLPAKYNTLYGIWAYRDYPVVYMNWYQADGYCRWAGESLPTEAQWEKAARGTDGRKYPWGNQTPTPRLANFNLSLIGEPVPGYRYPLGASPYGVLNMAGNVREWVADWFGEDYYLTSPHTDPKGPDSGTQRVLRSGSYAEDLQQISVYTRFKHLPDSAGLSRSFRCASN